MSNNRRKLSGVFLVLWDDLLAEMEKTNPNYNRVKMFIEEMQEEMAR